MHGEFADKSHPAIDGGLELGLNSWAFVGLLLSVLLTSGPSLVLAKDYSQSTCTPPETLPSVTMPVSIDVTIAGETGPVPLAFVEVALIVESGALAPGQSLTASAIADDAGHAVVTFTDGILGEAQVHFEVMADGIPTPICQSESYRLFTGPKLALHVQGVSPRPCAVWPDATPCSQYSNGGATRTGYNVYFVVGHVDPTEGLHMVTCGIAYDSTILMLDWVACTDGNRYEYDGPNGPWPASGGGIRFTWSTCQDDVIAGHETEGAHAAVGAFYLYAYSDAEFEVTPNNNLSDHQPDLSIVTCDESRWIPLSAGAVGQVRFSQSGDRGGYNPCSGEETFISPLPPPPPPPPPPPSPPDAMLLVHIGSPVSEGEGCTSVPESIEGVVTSAEARADGSARYFVYLLASSISPEDHLEFNGCQVGLEYTKDPAEAPPLVVHSWTRCSELEFPQDDWPASGTGNTMTWSLGNCQEGPLAPIGYLELTAYSPAVMSLVGYPITGLVKVADCGGAEGSPDEVVDPGRVGWVSLGGGAIGLDQDGCNPTLSPCGGPSPVTPTTWGHLKQLYKR